MATQLSGKFYESLAKGRSLEQSWQGACDFVRAQRAPNDSYHSLFFGAVEGASPVVQEVSFPWNLYNQIQTFNGHTEWITSVAFSPDGSRVLTGNFDHTAILWRPFFNRWEQGEIYKLSEEEREKYGISWEY